MTTSTLEISQRLMDAAAALQEAITPRMDAEDLEAAVNAFDMEALAAQTQILEGVRDSWTLAATAYSDGVADVMTSLHEPAVGSAAAMLEAISSELRDHGSELANAAESVQAGLAEFDTDVARLSEHAVVAHSAFGEQVQALEATYADTYEGLRGEFSAFGTALEQRLKPDLARRVDEWLSGLEVLRVQRMGDLDGELRGTFARAAEEHMDLVEDVGQIYRDAVRSAMASLERLAGEGINGTLEASLERLKNRAISLIENEIEEAIAESGLSVALTSAFSPIMPQLIAFYKAVTLLEEAIRVYKELKSVFGM